MEKNPHFLKQKYDLHNTPEVKQAVQLAREKDKQVSEKPSDQIQIYLDRFNEILERKKPEDRERGIEAVKRIMHRVHVTDTGTATTEYLKRQKRIAREQGHGDLQLPDSLETNLQQAVKEIRLGKKSPQDILQSFSNEQKQMAEEIVALITEQEESLDQWIDYLASPDATYPDWLKYWAIRNVVSLSKYDKEKKVFPKRDTSTINPFPDFNREALAYVLDALAQKKEGKLPDFDQLDAENRKQLEKLLAGENFAKLYAWAFEKLTPASAEALAKTDGSWVKFPKGSDATPLYQSLQGHGTGWCTAGESVAKSQLSRGDFYVYYSYDDHNKPTIPRAAIRMEGNAIAEVRGIATQQNLDPYIAPIVGEKMKEFPDGESYEKKAKSMKHLTSLEQKIKLGQPLTKNDLIFLYEINNPIEGFGYKRDPRIDELRSNRDPKADAPIVFECSPQEIAWSKHEINEKTKAYVGPLFPGIFKELGHLDYVYTSFPEGKIRRDKITIGGKDTKQLEAELKKSGFEVSGYAKHMMQRPEFSPQKNSEEVDLVRLTVKDLGFSDSSFSIEEIFKKAEELGLELCSAEVGPQYRLAYTAQPMNEYLYVAMKTISAPDGLPDVFCLRRNGDGLWLASVGRGRRLRWGPTALFVFRLLKKSIPETAHPPATADQHPNPPTV